MKKWFKAILTCLLSGLVVFGAFACGEAKDDGYRTVTFNLCTELETNPILPKEVLKGETVSKPIVAVKGDNPDNAEVEGWYLDEAYTQPWTFLTDTVETDITLYAKWVKKYDVYYYLGNQTETYMYKEQFREGSMIIPNESLSDGFRSDGLFADPEFTIPFVAHPIQGPTNIYIHRSDEFYFGPKMITRFEPMAAPSGAGSIPGNIELVGEGEDQYAKVNFGYSTAADQHIWLRNVTVDITHSQKVKIVMKNMGKAKHLKFYLMTWYDNETMEMPFKEGFTEAYTYLHEYTAAQMQMTEDSEWLELTMDFSAATVKNGISAWANSSTLVQLRIDSPYVSEDENDLSNEIWIKSIEGIKDSTYVTTGDNAVVAGLTQNDDAEAVKAVADAQQDVVGWVFPKDYESVKCEQKNDGLNITAYNKTSGLLMYAPFRTKEARMQFVAGEKNISLDENTTFVLRLRNYGYATTLKLTWRNINGRSATQEFTIPASMKEVVECEFNMFGARNWTDLLDTLTLEYTSIGVDNAILFESVEFKPYKAVEVPGFNFDDRNVFGIEKSDALEAVYNSVEHVTELTVNDAASAVISKDYTRFTNMGYKSLALNYKQKAEGVTKVIVTLTVDGEESVYTYDVGVAEKLTSLELPITKSGNVTNFKMTFEGNGEIAIQSVRLIADATASIDFAGSTYYDRMKQDSTWSATLSNEDGLTAAVLGPCAGANPSKYYFGIVKREGVGNGCISLEGKTKVVVVYYNPGTVNRIAIGLGLANKTADESWKTAHSEAGSASSGGVVGAVLQQNMQEGEWAVAEIDLTSFRNLEDASVHASKVVTMMCMHHHREAGEPDSNDDLYIRLIAII